MKVLIAVTVFSLWLCSPSFATTSKKDIPPDGSVDVQGAADAKKQEGQIGTSNKTAGGQLKEVEKVIKEQQTPKEQKTPIEPKKEPVEKPKKGK